MAISNFSAISAALGPSYRRSDQNRYVYIKPQGAVYPQYLNSYAIATDAVPYPSVADAGVNVINIDGVQFQYRLEQAFAGTAPQIVDAAGGGIKFVLDAANNDGIFFSLPWCTSAGEGTLKTAGKGIFTARTDGFFLRVKLNITTKANADEIAVGFRKVAAFDLSALTTAENSDFACLNVDNGTIKILTNLNGGTVSSTSTTQTSTDGTDVTLEVRVSESGYVKFLINGAAPTVDVTNFQFDSGDSIMPFLSIVVDATAADPVVILKEWESGLLTERGLDGVNDLVN